MKAWKWVDLVCGKTAFYIVGTRPPVASDHITNELEGTYKVCHIDGTPVEDHELISCDSCGRRTNFGRSPGYLGVPEKQCEIVQHPPAELATALRTFERKVNKAHRRGK